MFSFRFLTHNNWSTKNIPYFQFVTKYLHSSEVDLKLSIERRKNASVSCKSSSVSSRRTSGSDPRQDTPRMIHVSYFRRLYFYYSSSFFKPNKKEKVWFRKLFNHQFFKNLLSFQYYCKSSKENYTIKGVVQGNTLVLLFFFAYTIT